MINSEYPPVGGGASNATYHLARTFAARGHQVTVLTSRFADLPVDSLDGDVRVLRCRARRTRQDRSSAWEQTQFMLRAIPAALKLTRDWTPDVTIAFFGLPSGPAAWAVRMRHHVPFVVSLRGGDVPGFRPQDFRVYHGVVKPLIRWIWRKADAVVANSDGLRRLAAQTDAQVPIQVIPNGVDVAAFAEQSRDWSAARLVIVGRLVYQKGIDVLLQALAGLRDQAWELTVVGDGPLRVQLEQQATDLGLNDRVVFVGWLDPAAVRAQLAQATLFPYPSRDEGMPNAVLEAMAAGLPVVATHIAGNEELVQDGVNGHLVPRDDVDALRAALEELIQDHALRASMGAASRALVEANYAWERTADAYLDLIESFEAPD